ncbi:MAG: hypothetical protein V1869_02165 [Candidatus Omnitrophota bacterium]
MDKNRVVIILAVLTGALFIFNIGSCVNAYNQNAGRKKEMFQRMELEEKTGKLALDNANAAGKLKELQKQLDQEAASNLATKKALIQEQLISSSLKEDLQKLVKVKETLEEELKKQLKANKKAKK